MDTSTFLPNEPGFPKLAISPIKQASQFLTEAGIRAWLAQMLGLPIRLARKVIQGCLDSAGSLSPPNHHPPPIRRRW